MEEKDKYKTEIKNLLEQLQNNKNDSDIMQKLGHCYWEIDNISKAIEWSKKSAKLENSEAMVTLGLCYGEIDILKRWTIPGLFFIYFRLFLVQYNLKNLAACKC